MRSSSAYNTKKKRTKIMLIHVGDVCFNDRITELKSVLNCKQ